MHQENEKTKKCQIKYLMKYMMHIKIEDQQLKKRKIHIKWQSQIRHLLILDGNLQWLEHII